MHEHRSDHQEPDPISLERRHEQTDLNVRAVAYFIAYLSVGMVAVAIAMAGLLWLLVKQETRRDLPPSPLAAEAAPTPAPRLQALPAVDLARMREHDEEILNNYGWVSREGQVARMPIDVAMKRMLERPYPLWPITEPAQAAPAAPADLESEATSTEQAAPDTTPTPAPEVGVPQSPPQLSEEPAPAPTPVE